MRTLCRISCFCLLGGWVSLSGNEGIKWIKKDLKELEFSAQQGDAYAQSFLALCYIHGDKGLDISFDKAGYWANLSNENNHWLGWFTMGYLHRFSPLGPNSEKVGKFYKKTFKDPDGLLVKSASAGDPVASYVLAEIFTAEEVEPEISSDLEFASKHYATSSSLGYGPASVQHALLMLHASSIEGHNLNLGKDQAAGVAILEDVAKNQLPAGNHYLGRCYFKGIGVEEDHKMALVHFQAAADRGYTTSQLIVAHFYAYGLIGPPKVDLALRYANLALLQEQEKASAKISEYEQLLLGPPNEKVPSSENNQLDKVPSPLAPSMVEAPPLPPEPEPLQEPQTFKPIANILPSVYSTEEKNFPPEPPSLPENNAPTPRSNSFPLLSTAPVDEEKNSNISDSLSLAKQHYFGRGVAPDYNRAFHLFTNCAEGGNPEAARYLGIMYLSGKGVQKIIKKLWNGLPVRRIAGTSWPRKI